MSKPNLYTGVSESSQDLPRCSDSLTDSSSPSISDLSTVKEEISTTMSEISMNKDGVLTADIGVASDSVNLQAAKGIDTAPVVEVFSILSSDRLP